MKGGLYRKKDLVLCKRIAEILQLLFIEGRRY